MASSERGTKRTDPDTGKKFYDLNMDPIVSPYTGKSYPRSFFEQLTGKAGPATARKIDDEDEQEEEEAEDTAGPEIVSLEDADAEESGDDIPDVEDVEVDEELGDDEEDVFLEEDEDEDDGLGFEVSDDEDR
ncbi:MAG: TIGR02300 family protein [Pelagibacterium sp. SCN 64-44]|nr:MAG: TIGR02300 family protein [Pelagibacterium sp. SCN 64-44]